MYSITCQSTCLQQRPTVLGQGPAIHSRMQLCAAETTAATTQKSSAVTAPVCSTARRRGSSMAILSRIPVEVAQPTQGLTSSSHYTKSLDTAFDELEEIFCSKRGWIISRKEQKAIEATGGGHTYGELLPEAVDTLMQIMVAALPPSQQQQADQQQQPPVFIDLGSGLGRVVMQAALLCGRQFSRYIGLELSTSRLEQAETVLARLREEAGRQQDIAASDALARVDFYEEDVTQSPWLDAASHVFICSTAFGAVACRQIVDRLAASDKFQVLITSRELPFQEHLTLLGHAPGAYSWMERGGRLHVYVRRNLMRAPPHLLRLFLTDGQGLAFLPSDQPKLPFAIQEPVEGFKYNTSAVVLPALTR